MNGYGYGYGYGLWPLVAFNSLPFIGDPRLAIREEHDVRTELVAAYDRYAARVPRFPPHLHQAPAEIAAPVGDRR